MPNKRSYEKLKRCARYLAGQPRLVFKYPFQSKPVGINVYVNTDVAGCKATRRNTSGCVALYGNHAVKHWSKTQTTVCLSSGEAELRGIGDGLAQALGLQSIERDLGMTWRIDMYTDATAAIGKVQGPRGGAKMKHIDLRADWINELRDLSICVLEKVPGEENLADGFTKLLGRNMFRLSWDILVLFWALLGFHGALWALMGSPGALLSSAGLSRCCFVLSWALPGEQRKYGKHTSQYGLFLIRLGN